MKVRADFVTNSSSTSFVIITAGEFEKASFFELMGITTDSPLVPLFEELYRHLQEDMHPLKERSYDKQDTMCDWLEPLRKQFGDKVVERIVQADKDGQKVFIGKLSTDDGSQIEAFFALECFEIENEKTYFNALDCIY